MFSQPQNYCEINEIIIVIIKIDPTSSASASAWGDLEE